MYPETSGWLEAGDAIVLFTDGITEARAASGLVGAEGLERAVAGGAGAAGIAGALRGLIASDGIEIRDDVAVLVLEAV